MGEVMVILLSMKKILCTKNYVNTGIGGGGFTKGEYYVLESMPKNGFGNILFNFIDDMNDILQLTNPKASEIFESLKGEQMIKPEDIDKLEADTKYLKERYLQNNGWKWICNLPDCRWHWCKSLDKDSAKVIVTNIDEAFAIEREIVK